MYLTVYMAQKKVFDFNNNGLEVKEITKEEMYSCHPMLILEEHETGFVVSPMDIDAYKDRKGADEMDYDTLIEDIERAKEEVPKDKDKKKLEKAIEVIKNNVDALKGKSHCIRIMADIMNVPFSTIVEETQMMGLYRANMARDCVESTVNEIIGIGRLLLL